MMFFSDGATSEYKNKKNFINVCQHENDFVLIAEWNFFATSHGQNSCDGIGGTTKREVTRTSMQRPYNDQILTPQDMFKYCNEKITRIKYFFVSAEEINLTKKDLNFAYLWQEQEGIIDLFLWVTIKSDVTPYQHVKNLMSTELQLCLLTHLHLQTSTILHTFTKISSGWV